MAIRRNVVFVGMLSVGLTALLVSCGGSATSSPSPTPPTSASGTHTATVTLAEMKVTMPATLAAGKYTFTIANAGTVPHELLVFRSTLAPDKYPTQSSGAITEDGPGITKVSDGDNLAPGQSQTRDVDLSQPGMYLFVCNLPGHFAAHMYAVVSVTG